MSGELVEMLKEIEGVIRKYRIRLEEGSPSSPGGGSPDYKRFRILNHVKNNQPVAPEDLYSIAEKIGMKRQGLGGFFRPALINHLDGPPFESAMLRRDSPSKYARISLDRYGELELERLDRQFGSGS